MSTPLVWKTHSKYFTFFFTFFSLLLVSLFCVEQQESVAWPRRFRSSCVSLKGKRVGTSLVEANSSVLLLVFFSRLFYF
jgi:hypothetical protein